MTGVIAAIQLIEENKGFSDDDLALATTCIMSNEGLAKFYGQCMTLN